MSNINPDDSSTDIDEDDIDFLSWPPRQVIGTKREKEVAHYLYTFSFLVFIGIASWTVFFAWNAPATTTSEFLREDFEFPVVTICGNKYARAHSFGKSACEVIDFSSDETHSLECEVHDHNATLEIHLHHLQKPCVEVNSKPKAKKDDSIEMEISIEVNFTDDVVLENNDDNNTPLCPICNRTMRPKFLTLLISEESLFFGSEQFFTEYLMDGGTGLFQTKVKKDIIINDSGTANRYSLSTLSHVHFEQQNIAMVSLASSGDSIHKMTTTKRIAWVELIGSITGLFTYVLLVFALFYRKDNRYPNKFRMKERIRKVISTSEEGGKGNESDV